MKIKIKNVQNYYTHEVGDLSLSFFKYTEEEKKNRPYEPDFSGIVVHFNGDYVSSFLLSEWEREIALNSKEGYVIKDLGYIIEVGDVDLNIINLGSYATYSGSNKEKHLKENRGGHIIDTFAQWSFLLNKEHNSLIISDIENNGSSGFRKAVKIGLKNRTKTDFLLSQDVPLEYDLELDFNKPLNWD